MFLLQTCLRLEIRLVWWGLIKKNCLNRHSRPRSNLGTTWSQLSFEQRGDVLDWRKRFPSCACSQDTNSLCSLKKSIHICSCHCGVGEMSPLGLRFINELPLSQSHVTDRAVAIVQLVQCLIACKKPWVLASVLHWLGMVVPVCKVCT